jgi:asparagine synthase (glutamine-hydrolysing)
MSGLAAVFHRDGKPVASAEIEALMAGVRGRGPDREGVWLRGSVGLGHALLASTPQAVGRRQPLVAPEAGLTLIFDGRLDEREDLARALDLRSGETDGWDDAALVLAAYGRWRDDAFARLCGDFALVLWDAGASRLVCARDILGLRPLCVHLTASVAYCASTAGALAAHLQPEIDEGTIAETLVGRQISPTRTLYAGIERVPAGHLLIIERGRQLLRPYWSPDGTRELRYRTHGEYEDALRSLLDIAVAARLRAPAGQPVGLMLSGGLDSGAIYATAAAQGRALSAFTLGVTDPALDETSRARATVSHVGGAEWVSVAASASAYDFAGEVAETRELPTYPTGVASYALRRQMAARGGRVLLNGVGSDEWFYGHRAHLADLLFRGRLLAFAARWRVELALPDSVGTAGVWRDAVWPLVPSWVRPAARRLVVGRRLPPWMDAGLANRVALADRLRAWGDRLPARSHAARQMIAEAWSPAALAAREDQERFAVRFGLEDRAPFYDRRIVDFALALPEDERRLEGLPKSLLRRAMAGRLPEQALQGTAYGDYSHFLIESLEQVGSRRMMDHLTIAERGWVIPAEVRLLHARLDAAFAERAANWGNLADEVWAVVAVELWHRGIAKTAIAPHLGVHVTCGHESQRIS